MILKSPLRQVDAANARLPASPQARLPAALLTSSAKSARTRFDQDRACNTLTINCCISSADAAIFLLCRNIIVHHIQKGHIYMVHQYKLNGYNIVLDSESGCVHTVDDVGLRCDRAVSKHTAGRDHRDDHHKAPQRYRQRTSRRRFHDIDTLKDEHQLFTRDLFCRAGGIVQGTSVGRKSHLSPRSPCLQYDLRLLLCRQRENTTEKRLL